MQIVSDRGMDLSPEQSAGLDIHLVPLTFTLDGKTYRSGVDVQPDEFYKLLEATESFPTTSQPAPGDFADVYRRLAATRPGDPVDPHLVGPQRHAQLRPAGRQDGARGQGHLLRHQDPLRRRGLARGGGGSRRPGGLAHAAHPGDAGEDHRWPPTPSTRWPSSST